jgi:glycosyltransferase involved in cell wall biosynthesis
MSGAMKLLCLAQNFHQGWGGAPESIRLLARSLASAGVSVDVYDRGDFHPAVEMMELLPRLGAPARRFSSAGFDRYSAIIIAGPWQSPRSLRKILRLRDETQTLFYLSRGGLGEIEFSRPRDLKKWPYLYSIERPVIDACSAAVFSSKCEQRRTIRAVRNRTREVVIPDFFSAPEPVSPRRDGARREVRFGFLAEISPRKGLVPLVEAFVRFAARPGFDHPVRLSIGGAARAGSEAYAARARELARRAPPHAPIDFLGPVPHDGRPSFYAATDVFLAPSLFESYGLTVLEALAAGCAEIAAPELGVLEYLPRHEQLTIARSARPEDLADALATQFDNIVTSRRSRREETCAYARNAIEELNARAMEQWMELME